MTNGRTARFAISLLALVLLAGACRSESDDSGEPSEDTTDSGAEAPSGSGDFGSLTDVCQDGDASGATAQGVTDEAIQVGVLTDFGFTQNSEFIDAAEAFTSWCNAAGGINGRELTFATRDAKLFEYRQRIIDACQEDFMLVGGGAAFDGTGVRDRIECLLPELTAQTVAYENQDAGLQVEPFNVNPEIGPYEGYYKWLVTEAHPETAGAVGIIAGDIGPTRLFAQRETETLEHLGATVVYSDIYPAAGVSDWLPYAQALKDSGVQGLIFLGNFVDLPLLEQALIDVQHTLTWIDANTNAYNQQFVELAGGNLDAVANYSAPNHATLEMAADLPAVQELIDIVEEHADGATITGPMIRAWSAWLLFATAARDCGDEVTRRCVFDNATAPTDWDGGGLTAPIDLSDPDSREVCFVVMQASSSGWEVADFGPNEGGFRCEEHELTVQGDYPDAVTLEDAGVTLDDLE